MSDNRIVIINRRIPNLQDTAAINGLRAGEWFVDQSTGGIYWKNPRNNAIEPLGANPTILNAAKAISLNGSGTVNIDPSLAGVFYLTATNNVTFNLANVPNTPDVVHSFILEITNGGNFTVNWFGNLHWGNGIPPTLTRDGKTILGFYGIKRGTAPMIWTGTVLAYDAKVPGLSR